MATTLTALDIFNSVKDDHCVKNFVANDLKFYAENVYNVSLSDETANLILEHIKSLDEIKNIGSADLIYKQYDSKLESIEL